MMASLIKENQEQPSGELFSIEDIVPNNWWRRRWPTQNYVAEATRSPFSAYCCEEEANAKQITGVRQTGQKTPDFIDLQHEKEVRLLTGVPAPLDYPPDSTCDRPFIRNYLREEAKRRKKAAAEELRKRRMEEAMKRENERKSEKIYVEVAEYEDAGDFEDL